MSYHSLGTTNGHFKVRVKRVTK